MKGSLKRGTRCTLFTNSIVLHLQARLYNELGYTAERNKCALEFRQLDQLFPTPTQLLIALP